MVDSLSCLPVELFTRKEQIKGNFLKPEIEKQKLTPWKGLRLHGERRKEP